MINRARLGTLSLVVAIFLVGCGNNSNDNNETNQTEDCNNSVDVTS